MQRLIVALLTLFVGFSLGWILKKAPAPPPIVPDYSGEVRVYQPTGSPSTARTFQPTGYLVGNRFVKVPNAPEGEHWHIAFGEGVVIQAVEVR